MNLRNSNGFELRNFYLKTVWKLFFPKIFIRSGKMHHVELNSGTSKSSKQQLNRSIDNFHKNEKHVVRLKNLSRFDSKILIHLTSHLNNVETCVINMIMQDLYFGFCQTFQLNRFVCR